MGEGTGLAAIETADARKVSHPLQITMASAEKFQAGESYGDQKKASAYSLDDPVKIAQDLLKELASVRSQVTPHDLVEIIQSLTGKPLDDKKG
jgi:hypothetical protein